MIYDGPMAHITSGKVMTNMFLIWAGLDGQDIYENFRLTPTQKQFEELCVPICNFRAARFKFSKVYQKQGERVDMFSNRILKICSQCEFSDPDERLIDAIIFGMSIIKAQDKLLQMPKNSQLVTVPYCM